MKSTTRGFTIVELMVTVLLGSILTLAAVQLFGVNQRTFQVQQTVTRVLDDGQLALRFLSSDLRQAGYSGNASTGPTGIIFGGATGSAQTVPNDRITIRFNGTQDCSGTTSPVPVAITNQYRVNAAGELTCLGSLAGGAPIALIPGVEGLRILYGIDTTADGAAGPIRFYNATAAGPLVAAGRPVLAIRVALLLGVDAPALPDTEARTWRLFDRAINKNVDRVSRRAFYSTIMVRNVDWSSL